MLIGNIRHDATITKIELRFFYTTFTDFLSWGFIDFRN